MFLTTRISRIIIMLLTTQMTDNKNFLVCCYIHQKREIVKNYIIYWPSSHVHHTWEIWRPYLPTSSLKGIHRLSSTRNIGVKSSVQYIKWNWITAGRIISSSSILRKEKVNDYIYLGFKYMHLPVFILGWLYESYTYHVLMTIIWFLRFSIFYANIMLLMILI